MKSRAKVISQKHIKEIPSLVHGFNHFGLIKQTNETESRKSKRAKRGKY